MLIPTARTTARGPGLADFVRAIRRESPPDGPAWLLLADADLAFATDGLAALDESDAPLLAAADPSDGAVVLLPGECALSGVFVSPNLRPVVDPSASLTPARDRALPASLESLPGPRPIALRISLDRPAVTPLPSAVDLPLLATPAVPRAGEGLDLLIERKLRDLLGPVVSRLLAETRGIEGT